MDDLLAARHSCRGFLDKLVPQDVLEQLLTMAQQSPSWCNSQPWQLVITRGPATDRLRAALRDHSGDSDGPDFPFPEQYTGVYQQRRRECGWQLYESLGIAKDDREASRRQTLKNFEFFDAPQVAIVTTTETLGVYGAVDCGVYVGNFLLAARSLGLDTVPQAAIAMYSAFLRNYFELPADRKVVCGISFGYSDEQHPVNGFRTSRAPIDEVATVYGE
ncbi:nitroreductase [Sciscionella marina]|uniref:nitroreductase n=1 Tax=Sciscionella marina TaxID=508770 RepID=UPI001969A783|nr:nitroreductase [Sciscionella marina]